MKIAFFTDTYMPEVNGVTSTLNKLSIYLEKKGIQHAFFAPDYDEKDMISQVALSHGKVVHRFQGMKHKISPSSRLSFPRTKEIFELCDSFAPDLVHVITEVGIGYKGMKYATSRKLPLIMSYHTDYIKYLSYYNLKSLESILEIYLKWFYSHPHKILVPSKHTLEQLANKDYKNLDIWSRGIDADNFNPKFRSTEVRNQLGIGDKFAFLYVGRITPEKGLHMLLHAIEKINSLYPDKAVFVFTGDGSYSETIRKAGFDNVVMTGFKTGQELSQIYASCDCFAFPSGTETFGNAPLEAMASGLPVIGVNNGGVTEFLTHGYNSLLCQDRDYEVFTNNLIQVMQDQQLRSLLTVNGCKTARSRNWDGIFDGLMEVYNTVILECMTDAFRNVS